jgi:hypothetical protein
LCWSCYCSEETIILSASGTAARINFDLEQGTQMPMPSFSDSPVTAPAASQFPDSSGAGGDKEKEHEKGKRLTVDIGLANQLAQARLNQSARDR